MSGAATTKFTAHDRSGASAGSSGDDSSLCAIATKRWRSSAVECFSASGDLPACGAGEFWASASPEKHVTDTMASTDAMSQMNRLAKAVCRRRSRTAGLRSFFLVFTTLAGRAYKIRQLALLLFLQQSVQ